MAEEVVTTAPQELQTEQVQSIAAATPTTESTEAQSQTAEVPHKIKVKHLHEERELTEDEARPYIQKGMDYDRVKAQAEELRDYKDFVERTAKKYGMPVDQFRQEMEAAAEQTKIQALTDKGVPEDIAKEIVENREFREEVKAKETAAQAEARKQKEAAEFVKEYPGIKGEDIPQSVWKDVEQGIPLLYAYAKHDAATKSVKMAELEKRASVAAKNEESAASTPGSITGTVAGGQDFFSEEAVSAMSRDDVVKNYDKIMASRKHWKK